MKQFIIVILFLFVSNYLQAQVTFEKGYFIDNDNQKVECLIKNEDWRSNPSQFKYKKSENDESILLRIEEVKEFGIYDASKYIRQTVKIDRSSKALDELSIHKAPIFEEEQLFLRVILEGKASLYSYQAVDLIRFFYKKEQGNIKQLIFKYYEGKNNRGYEKVRKNNTFRAQIFEELKCSDIQITTINNLEYKRKDLIKIFSSYNKCHNSESIYPKAKAKKNTVKLYLKPRVNYNSFDILNDQVPSRSIDFEPTTNLGIGVELEYIIPFYKNKWSLFIDPNYQQFTNREQVYANTLDTFYAVMEYRLIELPLGVRRYFFLNSKSKLNLDLVFMTNIDLNSSLMFQTNDRPTSEKYLGSNGYNIGLGLGYNYNNKYTISVRYNTNRNIFTKYVSWRSEHVYWSFILGYSFF